jgi:cell division septum initiation protein DivIVA
MKRFLIIVSAIALCLSSCGDKEAKQVTESLTAELKTAKEAKQAGDREIARLQRTVAALKDENASLEGRLDLQRRVTTSLAGKVVDATKNAREAEPVVSEKPPSDEDTLAAFARYGIQGIPTDISQKIVSKAQADNRYAFAAVSDIQREAAGYLAVIDFESRQTTMPVNIRNSIASAARREHPGKWSRMADEIKEEADSWHTLNTWKTSGAPGLNLNQTRALIAEAEKAYPNNWSMTLFRFSEDSKEAK